MGIPVYLKPVDEECDLRLADRTTRLLTRHQDFAFFCSQACYLLPSMFTAGRLRYDPRNAINRSWLVDRGTHDD